MSSKIWIEVTKKKWDSIQKDIIEGKNIKYSMLMSQSTQAKGKKKVVKYYVPAREV